MLTKLDKVRWNQNGFSFGLTSEDDSEKRPCKVCGQLRGFDIQQQHGQGTIGN